MATIASATAKLGFKQRTMVDKYMEGVGSFLGVSAGQIAASPAGQSYQAKISDPDMPNRWARNYRRAFGV